MVARVSSLPSEYIPYAELGVCSNVMRSGIAPFVIKDIVPILVGRNSHPKVWLSGPADDSGTKWIDLVEAGQSKHDLIKVFVSEDKTEISVQFRQLSILEVKAVSPTSAHLHRLDMRPIGINVFGDKGGLSLGTNRFSNNSFTGTQYMIRLG